MLRTLYLLIGLPLVAGRPPEIPFEKLPLDLGANEACAFADLNGDGRLDIVSGENWYEAPKWTKHHFREIFYSNNYIDDFSDLPLDADGDGDLDLVSVGWFSKSVNLWLNPGKAAGEWKMVKVEDRFNVEFAFLVDLDNDGKKLEVLPQFGNKTAPLTWYEFRGGKAIPHVVANQSYGHGIGAGDVNGDGRNDILTPKGWWEAPADPRAGAWTWHGDFAGDKEMAFGFLHVTDVDGDGKNDIVSSYAHDYGLFWMKNLGGGQWQQNMIDDSWSQAHATTLVDLNRDGKLDIVTGKRFMAHNGRDPGEKEPLGVYWYESMRSADGKRLEWVKHVVDYSTRTGGGMQIPVADLDGDGDLDFATAGKSGLFLFLNRTK